MLGRTDYQLSGGRFSVRYSFSDNDAKNANATGNALADTTVSALSNNGTERDRTNTFVGQYTSDDPSERAARDPRPVFKGAPAT